MKIRRGFSLMEVVVALTLNAIVLTAAVSLYAVILQRGTQARRRASLERDATLVQGLFERELRLAGLGVPGGKNLDTDDTLTGIVVAAPNAVGILADLPRPDAQYPTFGLLSAQLSTEGLSPPDNHLWWFTENNGNCQPDGATGRTPSCTTAGTSVFFAGVAGCGRTGSADDRTCPWGLRRLLPGEVFQVIYPDGTWVSSQMKDPIALHTGHDLMFVEVQKPLNAWNVDATVIDPGSFPRSGVGAGFVVSLDRVFYVRNGTTLTRQQCWGDPGPQRPQWPPLGATTVPATLSYADADGETICTPAEVIARHVKELDFTYVDADGVVVDGSDPDRIQQIRYSLVLEDPATSPAARHEIEGAVLIRNQRTTP